MPKIVLGISSSFCASFIRGQVSFLNEQGYSVVVISGKGEEISMLCKAENAKLYTVSFTKRFSIFGDILLLAQIVKILRTEKPDIVNAGNPKSGFLIMVACWLLRIKKRIFTLHGLLSDTKKGLARLLITSAEKVSCKIARKVIVVGHSIARHAIETGILNAEKSIVIGAGSCNGINTELFSRTHEHIAAAAELRKGLHITAQNIVYTYVGRINKDKGVDLFFEAFDNLKKDYPQLKLLVVGPIEYGNPIESKNIHRLYHDEDIMYLGKLHDVNIIYAASDVLVLPSYREGFNNVLIEAAAMEVPVIASDIPGCNDALKNNYNGFLIEKGNATDLTAKMKNYLDNPDLRKLHGANGRRFVLENFQQQPIWQGQLEVYEKL